MYFYGLHAVCVLLDSLRFRYWATCLFNFSNFSDFYIICCIKRLEIKPKSVKALSTETGPKQLKAGLLYFYTNFTWRKKRIKAHSPEIKAHNSGWTEWINYYVLYKCGFKFKAQKLCVFEPFSERLNAALDLRST